MHHLHGYGTTENIGEYVITMVQLQKTVQKYIIGAFGSIFNNDSDSLCLPLAFLIWNN